MKKLLFLTMMLIAFTFSSNTASAEETNGAEALVEAVVETTETNNNTGVPENTGSENINAEAIEENEEEVDETKEEEQVEGGDGSNATEESGATEESTAAHDSGKDEE